MHYFMPKKRRQKKSPYFKGFTHCLLLPGRLLCIHTTKKAPKFYQLKSFIVLYMISMNRDIIIGYLRNNPRHARQNRTYVTSLYLYKQVTTIRVKSTSVIYIFFYRFHYHSFVLCFFFYFLSLIIHNAHDIIASVIIYKPDTH